jgi:hypothetical protein
MLNVKNRTPFHVAVFPYQTADGRDFAAAVVKATFTVGAGSEPDVALEQQPIRHAAEHRGEPGKSSLVHESDMWPPKGQSDVVLVGHARSPSAVTSLDVALRVGTLAKTVRVFGDRVFETRAGIVGVGPAAPFTSMPLTYERAFGGADLSAVDADDRSYEERNPVGVGFVGLKSKKALDGEPLPNLEDPRLLLQRPGDRPPPACFGFIAPHWWPRALLSGTYDDGWRSERAPLLPLDFDPRFYQAAHPELQSPGHLVGGEAVEVSGVERSGKAWAFALPRRTVTVTTTIKRRDATQAANLDTVVLEPDDDRVTLTWRASIPCGRDFLYIDTLIVEAKAA